ncbi:transcription initiation protein [Neolewinella aurantiaca]|uniref:Transcription initiation protein n=1 Tax=Neolewinella aurantiaca TaxID=2602767 RepID=A0A5C7FWT7_9BACT|nr:YciI family protein [Neolewinella aurantiaca]TXF90074.1 transcription initiation protein [Neolewinella aurantiaca]
MQDFMMLFRSEENPTERPSPEALQAEIKLWEAWIGGIAAQGKFLSSEALDYTGKTLMADGTVTDGPYTELKEIIGGYILLKATDWDDAVALAKGCPVLSAPGGKVEIRPIMDLG